jgi:hypothetical protein
VIGVIAGAHVARTLSVAGVSLAPSATEACAVAPCQRGGGLKIRAVDLEGFALGLRSYGLGCCGPGHGADPCSCALGSSPAGAARGYGSPSASARRQNWQRQAADVKPRFPREPLSSRGCFCFKEHLERLPLADFWGGRKYLCCLPCQRVKRSW